MINDINNKIEETLSSLDNIGQANAPNFFETRLRAKMEKTLLIHKNSYNLKKPIWAVALLTTLLFFNVYAIKLTSKPVNKQNIQNQTNIQGFIIDYQLNTNSSQY